MRGDKRRQTTESHLTKTWPVRLCAALRSAAQRSIVTLHHDVTMCLFFNFAPSRLMLSCQAPRKWLCRVQYNGNRAEAGRAVVGRVHNSIRFSLLNDSALPILDPGATAVARLSGRGRGGRKFMGLGMKKMCLWRLKRDRDRGSGGGGRRTMLMLLLMLMLMLLLLLLSMGFMEDCLLLMNMVRDADA